MTEYRDPILDTILFFVLLAISVALHILLSMRKKQTIRREIQRLGGQIVKISEIYGDRDRETFTYQVEFTDESGQTFQTSCKVRSRVFGSKLYWTQSPAELMNSPYYDRWGVKKQRQPTITGVMAEVIEERAISELKQQAIDKLSAENQQLKQELEQLHKNTNADRK